MVKYDLDDFDDDDYSDNDYDDYEEEEEEEDGQSLHPINHAISKKLTIGKQHTSSHTSKKASNDTTKGTNTKNTANTANATKAMDTANTKNTANAKNTAPSITAVCNNAKNGNNIDLNTFLSQFDDTTSHSAIPFHSHNNNIAMDCTIPSYNDTTNKTSTNDNDQLLSSFARCLLLSSSTHTACNDAMQIECKVNHSTSHKDDDIMNTLPSLRLTTHLMLGSQQQSNDKNNNNKTVPSKAIINGPSPDQQVSQARQNAFASQGKDNMKEESKNKAIDEKKGNINHGINKSTPPHQRGILSHTIDNNAMHNSTITRHSSSNTSSIPPLMNGTSVMIVGHVDAGKSSVTAQLLNLLGMTSQREMSNLQMASKQAGKASFALAWLLDQHEEERTRGITKDVNFILIDCPHPTESQDSGDSSSHHTSDAQKKSDTSNAQCNTSSYALHDTSNALHNSFASQHLLSNPSHRKSKQVCLIDCPGHADYAPVLLHVGHIADAAVLVIDLAEASIAFSSNKSSHSHSHSNASHSSSSHSSHTNASHSNRISREEHSFVELNRGHLQLLLSLGITQFILLGNKAEKVEWNAEVIARCFTGMLKWMDWIAGQYGVVFDLIHWLPVSAMTGENLTVQSDGHAVNYGGSDGKAVGAVSTSSSSSTNDNSSAGAKSNMGNVNLLNKIDQLIFKQLTNNDPSSTNQPFKHLRLFNQSDIAKSLLNNNNNSSSLSIPAQRNQSNSSLHALLGQTKRSAKWNSIRHAKHCIPSSLLTPPMVSIVIVDAYKIANSKSIAIQGIIHSGHINVSSSHQHQPHQPHQHFILLPGRFKITCKEMYSFFDHQHNKSNDDTTVMMTVGDMLRMNIVIVDADMELPMRGSLLVSANALQQQQSTKERDTGHTKGRDTGHTKGRDAKGTTDCVMHSSAKGTAESASGRDAKGATDFAMRNDAKAIIDSQSIVPMAANTILVELTAFQVNQYGHQQQHGKNTSSTSVHVVLGRPCVIYCHGSQSGAIIKGIQQRKEKRNEKH